MYELLVNENDSYTARFEHHSYYSSKRRAEKAVERLKNTVYKNYGATFEIIKLKVD